MAKIPLRVYTKEIENLIEHGEIEQAVSNAKAILKTYPKHIDTYRLLGKAFIESQRYAEAADILQRVLSVIPDDFFSQIGMSIIREDEGNLDAAIWHMERAYEVQPFNPAVQDELRRLYGRRDGVEPPKIRLTRGALIRMYTRGELYPQAIAETRAALAEDPQRADLRVLLARLYYLSGHKNDAAGICSELIGKLPYCLEANRLLTQILPGTSRADEARKFQQRIYALDPYEAFISPTAATSDQVPDQAVMIEPGTVGESGLQAPAWANTVGVQWDEQSIEEEAIPDWLNTLAPTTASTETEPATRSLDTPTTISESSAQTVDSPMTPSGSETPKEDEVPDWMKEAGWSKSERSADEIIAEQNNNPSDEEIIPAEIPDWLKTIAPQDTEPTTNNDNTETGGEWFDNLLSASTSGIADEAVPSTAQLSETPPKHEPTDVGSSGESDATEAETNSPNQGSEDDLPDWLSRISEVETSADSTTDTIPASELSSLPDWTQSAETLPEQPANSTAVEENPDWLNTLRNETADQQSTTGQHPESLSSITETPNSEKENTVNTDWLNGLEPRFDTPNTEEISTQPVEQAPSIPEEKSVSGTVVEPDKAQAEPAALSETAPDFSDTDAMMAWLESLAAKQGADEATLITPPEQRTETPPDWVKKEIESGSSPEIDQPNENPVAPLQEETLHATVESSPESLTGIEPDFSQLPEKPVEIEYPTPHPTDEAVPFDLNDDDASMAWMGALTTSVEAGPDAETSPAVENDSVHPDVKTVEPVVADTSPSIESTTEIPEAEPITASLSEAPATTSQSVPETTVIDHEADQTSVEPTQPVKVGSSSVESFTPVKEPAGQEPPAATPEMPDYNDTDAMMAWLESLAARQGADEATLITPPDQRTDTPPEWVKNEIENGQETEKAPSTEGIAETSTVDQKDLPDWLKQIEEENNVENLSMKAPSISTDAIRTAWVPEVGTNEKPVETAEIANNSVAMDIQALHLALQHGEVEKALDGYTVHINQGEHLDGIIQNLRDALYRYPVDIRIWQTLGDTLAKDNQLQEAIDAYTKAEELLR